MRALLSSAFIIAVTGSALIHDQILSYRRVLNTDVITVEGFKTLATLHDEHFTCVDACHTYLQNLLGDGLEWSLFENIVEEIYGDMISDDPYQPQEIHLAITPYPSTMKVMWATSLPLTDPFVEYVPSSVSSWDNSVTVSAVNFTYTVPKYWWPIFTGMLYEADMVNLVPGGKYKYRVGGFDETNATMRYGETFEFFAAPLSDPDHSTTIATIADQGTFMLLGFAVSDALAAVQDDLNIDMVAVMGDLCYAGLSSDMPRLNITKEDEFEHIWDLWGIQNQRIAATRPFMVGVGNHERFYDWAAFTNRYKMPASTNSNGNFWYSYNYGNVHWISLSSEHDMTEGSDQMLFLEADLAAAQAYRSVVPWIVVTLHKPLYSSDADWTSPGNSFQVALEPLLLQYDVDLTFTGHMHCYERVHPNINGEVTVRPVSGRTEENAGVDVYHSTGKGPVHVVQGNTGAMQFETWVHPKPRWSAVRFSNGYIPGDGLKGVILESNYTDTFGFGVATFINSTHMKYSNIPITGDIGVDAFWIVKNRN